MRISFFIFLHCLALVCPDCWSQDEIRLIIRGDDIGSTHAANLGCN